jgi:uncharacterized cupin superfamily protein
MSGWLRSAVGLTVQSLRPIRAAFPKGSGNGHHMINKSGAMAVYLEVGSRHPADVTTCSDIDVMSTNADGRFVHKDGTPYSERWTSSR